MRSIASCLVLALMLTTAASGEAAMISSGGLPVLSATSVPPPGTKGYVYYALGAADNTNFTTPVGVSSSGNFASPVSYVTIDTTGDNFFSSSTQNGGYALLTVNGSSARTGLADQPVTIGATATLATMTLGAGVPASFRLGVLEDNAPGPQNSQGAITVTGSNTIITPVLGTANGAHNDFYFFDITNTSSGDALTISVTNNGTSAGFAFAELGGFTFDAVPEPSTFVLAALGLLGLGVVARRKKYRRACNPPTV